MYYDDLDYARRRLEATLVRLKTGEPFFVERVYLEADGIFCVGNNYANEGHQILSLRDIDLTPVPLGFVNTSADAIFTCRKPMRRDWKQGLSLNSLVSYPVTKGQVIQNFKLLKQPIFNQYPDINRALSLLSAKKMAAAFSRDFALVKSENEVRLRYRIYDVGKYEDGRVILNPDKFFLEQHLNETVRK